MAFLVGIGTGHNGNVQTTNFVDVVIIEGTSSDVLINTTINKDMKLQMNLDEYYPSLNMLKTHQYRQKLVHHY